MQPLFSVTLEPGLEEGVPKGYDLYTFVTSAAGHMMRTLQKPQKNRRSKRQVNHRRFLHNMIQRKLADIEAANQHLASALYIKEDGKNISSTPSQEPETPVRSDIPSRGGYLKDQDKCDVHIGADGVSKSMEKKQSDSEHVLNQHPKPQPTICPPRKNNQRNAGQEKVSPNHKLVESPSVSSLMAHHHSDGLIHAECYNNSQLKSGNSLSGDSQTTAEDCSFIQVNQNMNISPMLSPVCCSLSLDSCDFSQESDIMDLFNAGNEDIGAFMDVDAYFESICKCHSHVGADHGLADQSESLKEKICSINSEMEDLYSGERDCRYEYGQRYPHAVQESTMNHFQSAREDTAETDFRMSEGIHSQLPTSISSPYNLSELQSHQQPEGESTCMLGNNQDFTLFEGVAQSFSVPLHAHEHCSIPTPLCEADWLFTDILKGRTPLDC